VTRATRDEEEWKRPHRVPPVGPARSAREVHGTRVEAAAIDTLDTEERFMPDTSTMKRAKRDLHEGKSPSTAAGEFVHEEIDHVRSGKHGARSARQAIAIGLSKARRAGVPLRPPGDDQSKQTRRAASRDRAVGQRAAATDGRRPAAPSAKRARAATAALEHEGRAAASHEALSKQARRGATAGRAISKRSGPPRDRAVSKK
jgi:hypothetical protein